jgi:flagellin
VVEGAYSGMLDNLMEMKTLATQAANGTIATGSDEMGYIASQLEALGTDINDISTSTKFNGLDLTGTGAATLTFQVGEGTSDTFDVALTETNMGTLFSSGTAAGVGLGSTGSGGDPNGGAATSGGGGTSAAELHVAEFFTTDDVDDAALAALGALNQGDSIIVNSSIDELLIDQVTVNAADMRSFMTHIDTAISSVNSKMNTIGISQRSLSGKEVNLTEAITANSAARSRIMDTDFAKEQSNSIRLQILQQTATAALSQANMGPQAVLGFLG